MRLADGLRSAPSLDVRAACAEALGGIGGDAAGVHDLFVEYMRAVSSVFRAMDERLLAFCRRLADVGAPLQAVLALCRLPGA